MPIITFPQTFDLQYYRTSHLEFAALNDEVLVVPNVHEFPGHIACDCASNSEIVIPIHKEGKVIGVLDIDSPSLNRFTENDKEGLSELVRVLEEVTEF